MFRHVIEQHAELVPFLWSQRAALAADPATAITDLDRFDRRLQANIEGLLLAGATAAPILHRAWDYDAPGVLFGRAIIVISNNDPTALDQLIALPEAAAPVVSALGFAAAAQTIAALAQHPHPAARRIAASGLRALRQTQGLATLLTDSDRPVALAATQAAGLSRCSDDAVLRTLRQAARSGDTAAAQALWIATGEPRAFGMVLESTSLDLEHLTLLARLARPEDLARWLANNRDQPAARARAIALAAAAGFANDLPWLAAARDDPEHAAAARHALTLMLGAGSTPESVAAQIAHAPPGQRMLGGAVISPETIGFILRRGRQSLRRHAAFEAARLDPSATILNVESPSYRQLFRSREYI